MYVIHDMDSGFVTYRKNKNDTSVNESEINEKFIFVYKAAVESWRNELKVSNAKKILVAFAWWMKNLDYARCFLNFWLVM